MTVPMVEARGLHKSYCGVEVLKGVNLTIEAGQVHAIMGKNGSGKSTLAKVMAGHPDYTVTSGDVLLDVATLAETVGLADWHNTQLWNMAPEDIRKSVSIGAAKEKRKHFVRSLPV